MRDLMTLFAAATFAASASLPATPADHLTSLGATLWTEETLGPQISTITVMGGAIGNDASYAGLMGQPARLAVISHKTSRTTRLIDMPGADGCYDIHITKSGTVYLASHPNGNLYRYQPGSDQVENLGRVAEDVTFVWELAEGPDGRIYGVCYPKSKLFEFNPQTKAFRDLGSAKEGEDYGRSILYDEKRNKLYIGVGSHAALIECDPVTGSKRDILPPELASAHFVYSLGIADDALILRMSPGDSGIILNPDTGKVVGRLPQMNSASTAEDPEHPGAAYYTGGGELMRYVPGEEPRRAAEAGSPVFGKAFHWIPAADGQTSTLLMLTGNGKLLAYTPPSNRGTDTQGTARLIDTAIPRQPIHLHNITCGPDGRIYTSGYVVGQLGVFDPATSQSRQYAGVKQAEGMTWLGTKLVLGTYPGAVISTFDTSKDVSSSNPGELFRLSPEGQDRPFGMLAVPEEKRVYIGTVPDYGQLGGVLAVCEEDATTAVVHRDLVPNQSIVTLAWRDGILYCGTTIHGGLGVEPTEKEGKLFLWDTKSQRKVFETVPVAGRRGLANLRFGPDGNLWGWAEGSLFIFDTQERRVVYTEEKFSTDKPPRHFWRGGYMLEPADGYFHGMLHGKIYRLNIESRSVEILGSGSDLELLSRDQQGRLYFVQQSELFRLTPKH